jgi:hypothetical protein
MPPSLQFSLLCDDVGRTGEGKMIIHGVFEGIVTQAFPAVHRACYVCNRWTGATGEFRERVTILAPDGRTQVLAGPETQFRLPNRASVHTVVCRLEGLTFDQPGSYWVQVWLDDKVVCEYALNVQEHQETQPVGPVRPQQQGPGGGRDKGRGSRLPVQ